MLAVIAALLPAALNGFIQFGMRALILLLVTTGSAMGFEMLARLVMRRRQTVLDCSAAVTGLLLGLNLPAGMPFWQAVLGSFIAVVIVKQLFGGLGQNFANPAIVARIVLMLSFPATMTAFQIPGTDAVSGATPLVTGTAGYWDLLLGNTAGCIGETSAAAILLGGLFLCICGIISPVTPLACIGSLALCTWLAGNDPLYQILSGGLMLGAIYMATDYATSPISPTGRIVFGVGCGAITVLIRYFGGYPEGVSFAILIMNLLVWYIDNAFMPRRFGSELAKKREREKEEKKA
jgi:electron transport complex protein RnfD